MSSVVISGDTSGSVTLQAPAVAGTTVLTLPTTNGTLVTTGTTTGISGSAITTGTVGVSVGGTGANTLTANNVILGNGTSAVQFVAPGTNGNLLTSNGTTWTSAAAPAGGVTSLNGQTGAITNTTLYAIGSYVSGRPQDRTNYAPDATVAGSSLYATGTCVARGASQWNIPSAGTVGVVLVNTGTWRCMSNAVIDSTNSVASAGIWVRIS
jgi:hypothetical protein